MQPLVGVIMGSKSDWETMSHAADARSAGRAAGGPRRLGPPHAAAVRVRRAADSAAWR